MQRHGRQTLAIFRRIRTFAANPPGLDSITPQSLTGRDHRSTNLDYSTLGARPLDPAPFSTSTFGSGESPAPHLQPQVRPSSCHRRPNRCKRQCQLPIKKTTLRLTETDPDSKPLGQKPVPSEDSIRKTAWRPVNQSHSDKRHIHGKTWKDAPSLPRAGCWQRDRKARVDIDTRQPRGSRSFLGVYDRFEEDLWASIRYGMCECDCGSAPLQIARACAAALRACMCRRGFCFMNRAALPGLPKGLLAWFDHGHDMIRCDAIVSC